MRIKRLLLGGLLVGIISLVAIGCSGKLSTEELIDGCTTPHSVNNIVSGIYYEHNHNPIHYADTIAGAEICVEGWVSDVIWTANEDHDTWVYIHDSSRWATDDELECQLSRQEASQIHKNDTILVKGRIPKDEHGKIREKIVILDNCEIHVINNN